jgi:hypothetical protein
MTDGSTTDAAVRTLLDKQAITEVLHRYCYAMDANDRALGRSVWHPDGTAHYVDMFEGTGWDFVEFGQSGHEAAFDRTSHQVTNVTIAVDDDHAHSTSYVTAACPIQGQDLVYLIRGRYLDDWSRRDGEWRIDARRFETDVHQIVPKNSDLMAAMQPSE